MKLSLARVLASVTLAFAPSVALAHAPVIPLHFSGAKSTNLANSNYPISGSSKVFYASIKNITGLTIKNTVLNAPLSNISGQLTGVTYYSNSAATGGTYFNGYNFPNTIQFGTANSLNKGSYFGTPVQLNPGNSISAGLPALKIFPGTIGARGVSGAERILQSYYNGAATSGYNAGISILQHPTGGLLFGTVYYSEGQPGFLTNPGFQAFGNNPYASNSVAMGAFTNLQLPTSTASYIQFGKFIRPISNGFLFGSIYYPVNYNPPYGTPGAGPYYPYGYFGLAVGSNPLNTFRQIGTSSTFFPSNTPTYFK